MSNDIATETGSTGGRPPLVLIAEDDRTTAEILDTTLERVGYERRFAVDGEMAVQAAQELPVPDVVLLDWMMPKLTGLEVCTRLRQKFDALELPILMVTAKTDPASIKAAFEAGASDYIAKPFLGAELRARLAAQLTVKRLSEERRALDEHLMERDKLSTLGLLVSSVAHELNNPLGGIYGHAQLLLEEEKEATKLLTLERIVAEVERCNRIVADLLTFSRRHIPERSLVDVREVLQQALNLRQRQLEERGFWSRLEIEPGLPPIQGDPHQLQQVFLNIVINAEHALNQGGSKLRISAENLFRDANQSRWIVVRIFNDGPRIPESVRSRIFDPFYTTKAKDEGTGLGLAICQRIVREHAGSIDVESDETGTTFHIILPVTSPNDEVTPRADTGP